ncbi:replication restart DNA helicase PriA [Frankia casuarinae]|uniref:primosomal protein N' n=1 Tax=Frankia TaxID=1854 RepID=UPI0003CFD75C|nr:MULTISPECIES: primosomal protein N' [Frankia]ETA01069.1 replication restart DNA helicase PriA [Frankia sp. CcI6]EYT90938.1 replication restart DNA helicase PriA [Frankia casuarinae]KDA42127.1 replication restart DNA helicase PriA [Frankia sp. BMG5.23]OFB42129.1 preprotein translocase subunit SecA [Frankia sp. CgIM4]
MTEHPGTLPGLSPSEVGRAEVGRAEVGRAAAGRAAAGPGGARSGVSRSAGSGSPRPLAARLPVARVAVDTALAHLDRPFDYLVPADLADLAVPGSRVRVRFAGRLVDGFVLERRESSDHSGQLAPLARSISPEPVLSEPVAKLARAVADRYAGTLADVLRLAVPPRHGRAEAASPRPEVVSPGPAAVSPGLEAVPPEPGEWGRYPTGPSLLTALAAGRSPRAVWWAPPGPAWPEMIAAAAAATAVSGRGVLVVVPDHRDVDRVEAAMVAAVGRETTVALRADLGPARRYRAFLAVSRGQARAVVGTRAAMFAPVAELGLVVVWDDGDDLHAEPLAPYPHARDVAVLRSRLQGCALVIGGFCPSTDAEALVRTGWAHPVVPPREQVRALAPRVEATGSDLEHARDPAARAARLPSLAVRTARDALAAGLPVLVQVPRRGYQPSLACADCRRPARCPHCQGPLGRAAGGGALSCRWCGRPVAAAVWHCPSCSGPRLRASVTGDRRTAEELGRAFPGVPVRTSGRGGVLATVPAEPALVISTPGAEPVADGGYGAVLLLDGWALLGRPDLRAGEETLRRWTAAAALARPAARGGRVIVAADAGLGPVQALVRWDPGTFVAREADERAELGFPPATRMASVAGTAAAVAELLAAVELPDGADVLGPVPLPPAPSARAVPDGANQGDSSAVGAGRRGPDGATSGPEEIERVLIRVRRERGAALAASLRSARGVLATRRTTGRLRIQLDPLILG